MALGLVSAAARQLRPAAPDSLAGLPEGVFVLAVILQVSGTEHLRGAELLGGRWSEGTVKAGTRLIADHLGKSRSLRRRFRRIVPISDLSETTSLMADYLLILDLAERNWDLVQDRRDEQKDPEEILSRKENNEPIRVQRARGRVYELTIRLDSKIERLAAGEEVWSHTQSLARYLDELKGEAAQTEYVETPGGRRVDRFDRHYFESRIHRGVVDLVGSQTRIDLAKIR